jgi:hypothetical protein
MANEGLGHTVLKSTQAVDFAAMVAGVIGAQLTVEGALAGDVVLVTKPSDSVLTGDVTLEGFCDTADTVDVVAVSNDSTATTNFGTVDLTVSILR